MTSNAQSQNVKFGSGFIGRFLDFIERAGNKLPDPVMLFIMFSGIIILLSLVLSLLGWSAVHPVDKSVIKVFNLVSREGLVKIMTNFGTNISTFVALTSQLVVMLGLALLEGTGLASALMRRYLLKMKPNTITIALTYIAVSSSVASDAGFMVLPPLAAVLFLSSGRNPLAGIIAAYGSVSAGFACSFFLGTVELVGLGITESGARLLDPNAVVPITSNYYFTIAASFVLPIIAFFVVTRIVEPRLGKYVPDSPLEQHDMLDSISLSAAESRGLRAAGIAFLVYTALVLVAILPADGLLRNPTTGGLMSSPFMSSILLVVTGVFFFPGLAFGYASGSIKTHRDMVRYMTNTYSQLAGYILVAVFASQLIKYFEWSNLGVIFAINGADFLSSMGVPKFVLMILVVIFVMILNFLMPSAAGKIAFMAPVLVPLFMMMDLSPAASYLVYRIGDSVTNAITPMLAYFVLMVGYCQKYKKDVGIGTLIASLLPFSVWFLLGFLSLLSIFYFFNLPIGPDAYIHYNFVR